jgi:hypothetical protein
MMPGRPTALAVPLVAAVLLTSASGVRAGSPPAKQGGERTRAREKTDRTEHFRRLETPHGPLYVWWPRNYNRKEAGIVVYVHGYAITTDRAWKEQQLPVQFKASRQNALFIVPEAPTENAEEVKYPNLAALLKDVARSDVELPAGPVVLAGHSGGFRSIAAWIDRRVSDIVLLDGLYARENVFETFVRQPGKRLILASSDTRDKTVAFCQKLPFAITRSSIPDEDNRWTVAERRARLLHVESQHEHNRMIVGGAVLPMLLKLTSLHRI